MIFRQLFDYQTWTYSYLLADEQSREAVLIDPVLEKVERDSQLVSELGLTLKYCLETHVHADHITGAGKLRETLGCRTVGSGTDGPACADVQAKHGDTIEFGNLRLEVRTTPGHTSTCQSYVLRDGTESYVFTGDTLLIRGCGRTDFQGGSAATLYDSIQEQLFSLPDDCWVYPGHDYRGFSRSTIGEEKTQNPRLAGKSKEDFIGIMSELKLASPTFMDQALPANLSCGKVS